MFCRNPLPVVGDVDLDLLWTANKRDRDFTSRRGVLKSVCREIANRPTKKRSIRQNFSFTFKSDRDLAFFCHGFVEFQNALKFFPGVDLLPLELCLGALRSCQKQETVDDL